MSLRRAAVSLIALSVLMFVWSLPVSAASPVNFRHMYDSSVTVYSSFKNISVAHNKWNKSHMSECAAGAHKWWAYKAHKDVAQAESMAKHLMSASAVQKKKHTYRDLTQTEHDLKHWSTTQITPKLARCKVMPANSEKVDLDLSNVANDLGLGSY